MDPVVLGKAFEQLDTLLQHAVPGVAVGVLQSAVLVDGPLAKQGRGGVFVSKESPERVFEGPAEQHGGASVFFLPAVKVAVAIAAGTGEVLADLSVAVGHQATSERPALAEGSIDRSSHWLAGAKPSRFSNEVPLTTLWLILTTPRSPARLFSSISSRPSSSVS